MPLNKKTETETKPFLYRIIKLIPVYFMKVEIEK